MAKQPKPKPIVVEATPPAMEPAPEAPAFVAGTSEEAALYAAMMEARRRGTTVARHLFKGVSADRVADVSRAVKDAVRA